MAILQELTQEIEKRREIDTKESSDRVEARLSVITRADEWVTPKVSRTPSARPASIASMTAVVCPNSAQRSFFLQNCLAQQIERARAIRGRCNP